MTIASKKGPLVLLAGDAACFIISLWLALFLRSFVLPTKELFFIHLVPFGWLFISWVVVFYIAGLYERHTVLLKTKLPGILFNAQVANATLAVIFFYFIPLFGITPKTVLFIYLIISFFFISIWRMYIFLRVGSEKKDGAILIGKGPETEELREEVNKNDIYNIRFVDDVEHASVMVVDLAYPGVELILPDLYKRMFSGVTFVDMHKLYEDVFNRIPLSMIRYDWFLKNVSLQPRIAYDALKRLMDIVLSLLLFILSLPFDVAAFVAIKLEDRGPAFIIQERVGKDNKLVKIFKFRTMTTNDHGLYANETAKDNVVTRVGNMLRKTRVDEFPQFLNVLKGDLSLVGPRPELPALADVYENEIPYYNVRHIIKPGLSGWAQIYQENHPHHGEAVIETKEKLSYDLYYVKNRSLLLDLKIALRTVKTLLSRVGK